MLHFERGNDGQAIADIDEALRLDPENAVALYVRGTVHVYLKRYDLVIQRLDQGRSA